jgi:hypothetical protein
MVHRVQYVNEATKKRLECLVVDIKQVWGDRGKVSHPFDNYYISNTLLVNTHTSIGLVQRPTNTCINKKSH